MTKVVIFVVRLIICYGQIPLPRDLVEETSPPYTNIVIVVCLSAGIGKREIC